MSGRMMLCPCCGSGMSLGARECSCGARFVGEPVGEAAVIVKRYGPTMSAALILAAVATGAFIFTKWLALAGVLAIWSSWRAMRLARRQPELYGGHRTAAGILAATIIAGAVATAYTVEYVPRFLENRRMRKIAATRAAMYHITNLLEDYKRAYGSYPSNLQVLKKSINESLPTDYWTRSIGYQSYTEAIADRTVGGIAFNNFELRSAGPDEKMGSDDDIIMRDGVFFTNSEIVKQPIVIDSADH